MIGATSKVASELISMLERQAGTDRPVWCYRRATSARISPSRSSLDFRSLVLPSRVCAGCFLSETAEEIESAFY
eukprot:1194848-Rhodomonas_salina.4